VASSVIATSLPLVGPREFSLSPAASVGESAMQDASSAARAWLDAEGWNEGWDAGAERLVAISTATVAVPPSSPGFHQARAKAFEQAFTRGRVAAAEFLEVEIAARMRSRKSLASVVIDPGLEETLTSVPTDEALVLSGDFARAVKLGALATVAGLTPMQTFVSRSGDRVTVAIVAAWGPRFMAAVEGSPSRDPGPGVPLSEWLRGIDDATLAYAWGHRFVKDEAGWMRPVAFGVARARPGMEDFAFDQAAAEARSRLGALQGERVASETASAQLAAWSSGSHQPDEFMSAEVFEQIASAEFDVSALRIEEVGRRLVAADPISGDALAIVACTIVRPSTPGSGASGSGAVSGAAGSLSTVGSDGCPVVEPRMQPYVRGVRASGIGNNANEAITAALLDAVRREGAKVEGDSRLSKRFAEAFESAGAEVADKVVAITTSETTTKSFANGFIHSFDVLEQRPTAGLVEVLVCANLVRFDPSDPRFGLPPTVAVMPWTVGPSGVAIDGRSDNLRKYADDAENTLERMLTRMARFQVLDERNDRDLQRYRDQIVRRAKQGAVDELELVKIGKALTADYLLSGQIDGLEVTDVRASSPSDRRAEVTLDARLVNVADGRIVWTDSARVILDGRTLASARAGRQRDGKPVEDEIERDMEPADLAILRASRKLEASLKQFLEQLPRPGQR